MSFVEFRPRARVPAHLSRDRLRPRYVSIQRTHDEPRCAVDGRAHRHARGRDLVGRAGLSQLYHLDLLDLAAESDDAFVAAAAALARDIPRLAALRAALRARIERSAAHGCARDSPRISRARTAAPGSLTAIPRLAPPRADCVAEYASRHLRPLRCAPRSVPSCLCLETAKRRFSRLCARNLSTPSPIERWDDIEGAKVQTPGTIVNSRRFLVMFNSIATLAGRRGRDARSLHAAAAAAPASSGTSSTSTTTSTPQNANLAVLVSDASTEDWATIGVKILSIALIPQGGGSNVTVYTAPSPAPFTNLVMLDQLDELHRQCHDSGRHLHGRRPHRERQPDRHPAHHRVESGSGLCRRRRAPRFRAIRFRSSTPRARAPT